MPRKERDRPRKQPGRDDDLPYDWKTFTRHTGLFAVLGIAIGLHVVAVHHTEHWLTFWFGCAIAASSAFEVFSLVPYDRLREYLGLRPSDRPTVDHQITGLRIRWRLLWIVIMTSLLAALVAVSGGPIASPFGQYLLGFCLLSQVTAPRAYWVPRILIISLALAVSSSVVADRLDSHLMLRDTIDYLWAALVIGAASTVVNMWGVSELAATRREQYREHPP